MLQTVLFESEVTASPAIPGLSYIPDFIDAVVERNLLQAIDANVWSEELKRRVQHYGYRYDYRARNVAPESKLGDIPDWLQPLCEKLLNVGLFQSMPDQVIVNEYQPGQGISAHTDCVPCFGPEIVSLSLGSPCVMDFSYQGEKQSLLLEERSLLLLSGDARYVWQHGIAARKTDKYNGAVIERARRVSLTFRTMRFSQ